MRAEQGSHIGPDGQEEEEKVQDEQCRHEPRLALLSVKVFDYASPNISDDKAESPSWLKACGWGSKGELTKDSVDYRESCDAEDAEYEGRHDSHRPSRGSTIAVALARHSGIVAAAFGGGKGQRKVSEGSRRVVERHLEADEMRCMMQVWETWQGGSSNSVCNYGHCGPVPPLQPLSRALTTRSRQSIRVEQTSNELRLYCSHQLSKRTLAALAVHVIYYDGRSKNANRVKTSLGDIECLALLCVRVLGGS